jgi:enoyl-CoA hydratase/carnithine racemase
MADFNADPAMRAGVLTGTGRAFSTGIDLKEASERAARGEHMAAMEGRPFSASAEVRPFSSSPKPFIAAVNGAAVGGGMEDALDCDIRICSTEAYFGLWQGRRGLISGYGMHHLPRIVGMSAANYILLTGDRITSEAALACGLVTEVVDSERLLPRAVEIAKLITANAPLSVEGTKAAIQMWRMAGVPDGYRANEWIFKLIFASEDAKEGANAFAEKRSATWKGR